VSKLLVRGRLRGTRVSYRTARPGRHAVGDRWKVEETYVNVAGQWRYVYRAIDQFGQSRSQPIGPVYPAVLEALLPAAWHRTDQYANNRVECDHSRLKARLRPMRGLKQDRSVRVVIAGHAFMQNIRRGHYELAIEEPATLRLAVAFDELALAI
jgi:transposase-like protein